MPVNAVKQPCALQQRIDELRERQPVDLCHGESLMLQGLAQASFREQRLATDQIALRD